MTNKATTFAIHASMAVLTMTEVRGVVGSTIEEMEEFLSFRNTFKDAWKHAVEHFPLLEELSVAGFHFHEDQETYGFILTNGDDFNLVFHFRRVGVSEIAAYTVRYLGGNVCAIFTKTPQVGWIELL